MDLLEAGSCKGRQAGVHQSPGALSPRCSAQVDGSTPRVAGGLPWAWGHGHAAGAPRTWEGEGRRVLVCNGSLCKDNNTSLDQYMGNEAGGQAHGVSEPRGAEEALAWEAVTIQEQPSFIAAQLRASLAPSGERS